MSAVGKPTHAQRLAALTEHALVQAEQKVAAGKPVSARELNGIRRLVERLEGDQRLAQLRELTTD